MVSYGLRFSFTFRFFPGSRRLITMTSSTRVYAGRLSGMVVRDPDADSVGRVRDVVLMIRPDGQDSRALGLVVEMVNKRRIFVPMLRIGEITPQDIILVTGSVSIRAYKSRAGEITVWDDLIGSKVSVDDPDYPHLYGKPVEIADVELERTRTRDWIVSSVAVFSKRPKFGRRPTLTTVPWMYVHGVSASGVGPEMKRRSTSPNSMTCALQMPPRYSAIYLLRNSGMSQMHSTMNDSRTSFRSCPRTIRRSSSRRWIWNAQPMCWKKWIQTMLLISSPSWMTTPLMSSSSSWIRRSPLRFADS